MEATGEQLAIRPRHRQIAFREVLAERLIQVSGLSAIIFIILIFAFLIREGAPTFVQVAPGSLLADRWYPIENYFGMAPLILGSLIVTLGAAIIALPLGLATAVFVAEVAPRWAREILKPFIEVLGGIPSVVL